MKLGERGKKREKHEVETKVNNETMKEGDFMRSVIENSVTTHTE